MSPDNAGKVRNSMKMQPIKVKIMIIKASWGPLKAWKALKSLGAPGKYPLSPLGRTTLVVTPLGVVVWWSCIRAY